MLFLSNKDRSLRLIPGGREITGDLIYLPEMFVIPSRPFQGRTMNMEETDLFKLKSVECFNPDIRTLRPVLRLHLKLSLDGDECGRIDIVQG